MPPVNQQKPHHNLSALLLGGLSTVGLLATGSDPAHAQEGLVLPHVSVGRDTTRIDPLKARVALSRLPKELGHLMEHIRIENPKGVVVQVDTVHGTPGIRDIRDTFRAPMLQAKEIVKHFADECNVRQIYHDGIFQKTADDLASIMSAYRALGENPRNPSPQVLGRLELSPDEARKLVRLAEDICRDSAVFELAKESSNYIFRPCESRALVKEGLSLKWGTPEKLSIIEKRENFIIENLVAEKGGVSIVVLGAVHDMSANIREWNAKHPQHQLEYIRVRPQLLAQGLGRE
jgi:hypothetical protein